MSDDLDVLCGEILKLDGAIRFAGIANNMGVLLAERFREGLHPLMTREELESYAIKAALRMKTREDSESSLGRTVYTFALYEKVKRASISLNDSRCSLLMVAFDVKAEHESIILDRIMPLMRRHRLVAES